MLTPFYSPAPDVGSDRLRTERCHKRVHAKPFVRRRHVVRRIMPDNNTLLTNICTITAACQQNLLAARRATATDSTACLDAETRKDTCFLTTVCATARCKPYFIGDGALTSRHFFSGPRSSGQIPDVACTRSRRTWFGRTNNALNAAAALCYAAPHYGISHHLPNTRLRIACIRNRRHLSDKP